ncbi:hypothetical protein [Vandammella animalimorsus]|uniref:hypothetical protein n=2 Tax=Vandammella animalimorsus TaxID=2029117 RepID=UPI001180F498|nr:hypothetical protein [Vandammella animalimorsus]
MKKGCRPQPSTKAKSALMKLPRQTHCLFALPILISGCALHSQEPASHAQDHAINRVKMHLRSNGWNDESAALSCNAMTEGGHHYVLCRFNNPPNEWGNHSIYVLNKNFEVIAIIPGR